MRRNGPDIITIPYFDVRVGVLDHEHAMGVAAAPSQPMTTMRHPHHFPSSLGTTTLTALHPCPRGPNWIEAFSFVDGRCCSRRFYIFPCRTLPLAFFETDLFPCSTASVDALSTQIVSVSLAAHLVSRPQSIFKSPNPLL